MTKQKLKVNTSFNIKREDENSSLFYSSIIADNRKQEKESILAATCFLITFNNVTEKEKETLYINTTKKLVLKVASVNAKDNYVNKSFKIIDTMPHFTQHISTSGKFLYDVTKKKQKYFLTKEEFDSKYQEVLNIK